MRIHFFIGRTIFLLLCAAGSALAQASIEGMVHAPDSSPLSKAEVTLLRKSIVLNKATTDDGGNFRFSALEAGDYTLQAAKEGYRFTPYSFGLRPRQTLSIMLEMAVAIRVEQRVEVKGMATDFDPGQTGTSRLITRSQIDAMPESMKHDIPTLALNLMPGAVLSHDNFVHVRGNEMSLHQFINGVSFLDNSHQQFTPGNSPELFEAANFITGGFSAEFGNRFGGVLDATTRSGSKLGNHGSVQIGGGSLPNGDMSFDVGGGKSHWGYFLTGGASTSDRFLNTPQFHTRHDHGATAQGSFQIDYTTQKDVAKLLFFGGGDNFELPNTVSQQSLGRAADRHLRSQSAILSWQHIFSEQSIWSSSAYERTVGDRVLHTLDPFTEYALGTRSTLTAGFKSDFSHLTHGHLLKMGVDITRLRLLESFDYDPRDPADLLGPFQFKEGHHGGIFSTYIQDRFTPLRDLTFDMGVRLDHYDLLNEYNIPSPRAAVAYHIMRTHSVLHFAYNRFFTPPPLEYQLLSSFIGRTNPDPDRRVGIVRPYQQSYYEAGWTQQFTPNVIFELSTYKHRGKNSFENSELGVSKVFGPTNYAHATSKGVEARLNLKSLQRYGIQTSLQYSAARTYFYGPFTGGISDNPLAPDTRVLPAFDEIHTATANFTYSKKWHDIFSGFNIRYGSGTPFKGGILRLQQHLTANFAGGFSVWEREARRISLEFNLENLSDDRYQIAKESAETPVQFAQGRVVSGRVKFHF